MAFNLRAISAAALIAGMALAPAAAQARDWHGGYRGGHGNYHHGGGVSPGVAVGAGILGLAVGAAIASGSQPYYAPPAYYAPPPAVYYGY